MKLARYSHLFPGGRSVQLVGLNKQKPKMYITINKEVHMIIALIHDYVREAKFTTKSRFEVVNPLRFPRQLRPVSNVVLLQF